MSLRRVSTTWRAGLNAMADVSAGAVSGVVGFVLVVIPGTIALVLAPTVLPSLAMLRWTASLSTVLARLHRARLLALLGVEITEPDRPEKGTSWLRDTGARLRSDTTWRQLGYHLVEGLLGPLLLIPVLVPAALGLTSVLAGLAGPAGFTFFGFALDGRVRLLTVVCGAAALLVTPLVAAACTRLDVRLARRLLGRSATEQLKRRVVALSESRAAAVAAAEAERRRIERDLHDGAQLQLTALALNLGMARSALRDGPPEIRELVVDAHELAKSAAAEIRALVRGLHPAVLDEQGLDAALSGIAAKSPVPVRVSADLPTRVAPSIETVAYFVVSELLANAAKHAEASQIEVRVRLVAGRLLITVSDDGRGGASCDKGSGLRGLHGRVQAVDGTLHIDSAAGRGTRVEVELPCA
ncbi:sensor domain-containing protein [Actinoplanes sp. HUAS TT8]|uniref:sensor histidine kinase n=1 Tax=Actinoplanes sp. HUAS TT8 TaxID=3447453 RepID=UPI003F52344F